MRLQRILPSGFEIVVLFILTVAVLCMGDASLLLSRYRLMNEQVVALVDIGQYVNNYIQAMLDTLDTFAFAPSLTMFVLWGGVGLVTFNVFTRAVSLFKTGAFDLTVSIHYIHPQNFSQLRFWRNILLDFFLKLVSIAGAIGSTIILFTVLLPSGFVLSRVIIYYPTYLSSLLSLSSAIALIWGGMLLMAFFLRLAL